MVLQDNLTAASSFFFVFFLDYLSYKLDAQQSLNKEKVSAPPDDGFYLFDHLKSQLLICFNSKTLAAD